jgi:hypothetical protein
MFSIRGCIQAVTADDVVKTMKKGSVHLKRFLRNRTTQSQLAAELSNSPGSPRLTAEASAIYRAGEKHTPHAFQNRLLSC